MRWGGFTNSHWGQFNYHFQFSHSVVAKRREFILSRHWKCPAGNHCGFFFFLSFFLFTFISLQHILVSLSKFLLLGAVCRQETRNESGHGGCRSPLPCGWGSVRRLPQWAAPPPAPQPGSGSTSAENEPLAPAAYSQTVLNDSRRYLGGGEDLHQRGLMKLRQRLERLPEWRLYKRYLSIMAIRGCSRIAGCFICLWSLLERQRLVL